MNWKNFIAKTLSDLKISKLTLIQEKVIPLLLKNKNVIGVSYTGTGKTLAYLLPILQSIDLNISTTQSIIISPTRELAQQIFHVINQFIKNQKNLVCRLLVGGNNYEAQLKQLKNHHGHILIATPQRFLATLKSGFNWNFSNLKYVIYDEVDMLIDSGFLADVVKLKASFNKINVTEAAFSATLHQSLADQVKKIINHAEIIDVTDSIWIHQKVKHYLITNKTNDKFNSLEAIVKTIKPYLCLIFVNNYKQIDEIEKWFKAQGINATILHGNLSSQERKQAYKKITNLQTTYAITTDLASRGLDIDGVSHIISWNLPADDIWYIHRSGRTSRAKYEGESYVMYDPKDDFQLQRLQKKGIIWIPFKVDKNQNLIKYKITFKKPVVHKLPHELQKMSNMIRATASKKVQPNYKKKTKLKLKKIYQKAKRIAIDKKVKNNLIKSYKIKNSQN